MRRALASVMTTALVLAGCASGPKLADVQTDLPKLPDGQGRIYFYRTQASGFAVQPGIYLNGQRVGDCEPKGVFVADAPAGDYEANTTTEVERKLSFNLAVAEEKFVRCRISLGVIVGHGILELVDPAKARSEMQNLSYTGREQIQSRPE